MSDAASHESTGQVRNNTVVPRSVRKQVFALRYSYVEDILEKQVPHRPQHLALCQALENEGFLLLGGALGNPPTEALCVFLAANEQEIESRFVALDPYVVNGLVSEHKISPWKLVVGSLAKDLRF